MQELENNLSYCYTQVLGNFQCIEHYLNLLAFKQNFAEITTTRSGTSRKIETLKKNILIFSHLIVCHPNVYFSTQTHARARAHTHAIHIHAHTPTASYTPTCTYTRIHAYTRTHRSIALYNVYAFAIIL